MRIKSTPARKKPQYPMETSVWDDSKRLLIFVGAILGIFIVIFEVILPIRNSIELTNEMTSIKLPPSFALEKTEQEYGSVCWTACPKISRTYTFSMDRYEADDIVREVLEAKGYTLGSQTSGGGRDVFRAWSSLEEHSIKITIDRRSP